jgi:hypothetical protein
MYRLPSPFSRICPPLRAGRRSLHPDNDALLCGKCHDPNDFQSNLKFQCQRCHADPNDTSDPLNGTLKAQYPDVYPFGFGSAPNVVTHSSDTLGAAYGTWGAECVTCHNPHTQEQNNTFGTSYGKLVKRTISFDNQATGGSIDNNVEFTAATGPGSFADGPPHEENICETCHTRTLHHRSDGLAPQQVHFDGEKCTSCHRHSDGFAPIAGEAQPPHNTNFYNANCNFCHLIDANGVVQFAAFIPSAECTKCHSTRKPHSSAVSGTGLYNYSTECVDCHDPMFPAGGNISAIRQSVPQSVVTGSVIEFTSKQGAGSFADGTPFNENICETCHTVTNHHRYDGQAPNDLDGSGNYIGHFDGQKCTDCHNHDNSWIP